MLTLIGLGVAASYLYSLVATLAPQWFPALFQVHGSVGVYFEAAADIVSLSLLGQLLELRARADLLGPAGTAGPDAQDSAEDSRGWQR